MSVSCVSMHEVWGRVWAVPHVHKGARAGAERGFGRDELSYRAQLQGSAIGLSYITGLSYRAQL